MMYDDRDLNQAANAAILAMDGHLSRAQALSVARAVLGSLGLGKRAERAPKPAVGVYQSGMACPNCAGRAWVVLRTTAECVSCGYALPVNASD